MNKVSFVILLIGIFSDVTMGLPSEALALKGHFAWSKRPAVSMINIQMGGV